MEDVRAPNNAFSQPSTASTPSDQLGRQAPLLQHRDDSWHVSNRHRPLLLWIKGFDLQSFWVWEMLSLSAAVAFYGVYFYLLIRYDNQLVATWEEDNANSFSRVFRTLQSAVSFIATLMKGAMLFPVASAIGQLKWHYMRQPRRAKAIELIDGASRGYWGALRLLISKDGLTWASFGSIITIGSILLGPFLQNTVQQSNVLVEQPLVSGKEALLPATNEIVVRGQTDNTSSDSTIGMAMLSSVQAGWATAAKSRDMQTTELPLHCAYEYCEWVNFTTLAVSSRCRQADVSVVRHPTSRILHGFSSQADIANIGRATNSTTGLTSEPVYLTRLIMEARPTIPVRSGYANLSDSLAVILHLGTLGYYNGTYHAAECVLNWAAHHYDFYFVNSTDQFQSRIVEYNKTATPVPANTTSPIRIAGVDTCEFNRTTKPCNYGVQAHYHRGLRDLLVPFLTGTSNSYRLEIPNDHATSHSLDFSNLKMEMFYGDWIDRIDYGDFALDGSLASQAERFMDNMALFITNNIRSNAKLFVVGVAGSSGPYFAIKRHYAAYPAAFLAASILFVSLTAWKTRREPIWKNSALALLYHGFEKTTCTEQEDCTTMESMERASSKRQVRLSNLQDGLGLKLRDRN